MHHSLYSMNTLWLMHVMLYKLFNGGYTTLLGKTTALRAALALIGAEECQLFSKITKQKILQLCCEGTLPVVVDDPEYQNDINRLIIDLYNGAKSGTITRGEMKPKAGTVIAANFTIPAIQR